MDDDLLPDSIVEKYVGDEADTGDDDTRETPKPAADDSTPSDDDDDFDLDDEEDTEDDDAGDSEPDDASADEDEDSDDDLDAEDDDDLDFDDDDEDELEEDGDDTDDKTSTDADLLEDLPQFDRKKLEQKCKEEPELGKAYKHLQALATRKTQEAARIKREGESLKSEADSFVEKVQTPEGAVEFIKDVVLSNPSVAAAAFGAVASSDGALDFLVDVALSDPERFEKAYERFTDLNDDPEEKDKHKRDRDLRERENRAERREERERQEARRRRSAEVRGMAEKLATKAGIDPEDFDEEVVPRLKSKIAENHRQNGKAEISNDEIKDAVRAARKTIQKREERIAARLATKNRKERQDEARRRARRPRRPAPPREASPGARRRKGAETPRGVDPLDHAIDIAFSSLSKND